MEYTKMKAECRDEGFEVRARVITRRSDEVNEINKVWTFDSADMFV